MRGNRTIYEDDLSVPASVTPIVGKAGTLTLWHGWMLHEGSMNFANTPRFAIFARYAHVAMRNPERWVLPGEWLPPDAWQRLTDPRYDVDADIWKYWGVAVRADVTASL